MGEERVFIVNGTGKNPYLTSLQTLIQMSQDLNLKYIKCPEENIRENLWDFGVGKDFLDFKRH